MVYNETATGGIKANGISPFFGTQTLSITSAGTIANGRSIISENPCISGGSLVAGLAFISTAVLTAGGILANGQANETFKPLIGGGIVAGKARETVSYYSNRHRQHRFQIGNLIYVLSKYNNRYVRQSILERLTTSDKDYWRVGLGWYSDKSVLSYDEFKVWRQRNQ